MERVKNIFATFFDINSFSYKRIIISLIILAIFFILKGSISKLIIKLFKKNKKNVRSNNFYKPLRILIGSIGLYLALLCLNPTEYFKGIMITCYRILLILLFTCSIANLVAPGSKFERVLRRKISKANDSMVKMICKTLKIIIYIIGILICISELGFNVNGIIAGLGIGGVAIALAAQDTASNIIGALMIILDKPFDVGDWILINNIEGSVEEFTFRSTRIRESTSTVVSIPNSTVVNSLITNWSRLQKRKIGMNLVLELNTPLKKVADVQNQILIFFEQEENILPDRLYVRFNEIVSNGYNLKIQAYTPLIDYLEYLEYLDKVNFNIMRILNENNVKLAYNSQTVYLKK